MKFKENRGALYPQSIFPPPPLPPHCITPPLLMLSIDANFFPVSIYRTKVQHFIRRWLIDAKKKDKNVALSCVVYFAIISHQLPNFLVEKNSAIVRRGNANHAIAAAEALRFAKKRLFAEYFLHEVKR